MTAEQQLINLEATNTALQTAVNNLLSQVTSLLGSNVDIRLGNVETLAQTNATSLLTLTATDIPLRVTNVEQLASSNATAISNLGASTLATQVQTNTDNISAITNPAGLNLPGKISTNTQNIQANATAITNINDPAGLNLDGRVTTNASNIDNILNPSKLDIPNTVAANKLAISNNASAISTLNNAGYGSLIQANATAITNINDPAGLNLDGRVTTNASNIDINKNQISPILSGVSPTVYPGTPTSPGTALLSNSGIGVVTTSDFYSDSPLGSSTVTKGLLTTASISISDVPTSGGLLYQKLITSNNLVFYRVNDNTSGWTLWKDITAAKYTSVIDVLNNYSGTNVESVLSDIGDNFNDSLYDGNFNQGLNQWNVILGTFTVNTSLKIDGSNVLELDTSVSTQFTIESNKIYNPTRYVATSGVSCYLSISSNGSLIFPITASLDFYDKTDAFVGSRSIVAPSLYANTSDNSNELFLSTVTATGPAAIKRAFYCKLKLNVASFIGSGLLYIHSIDITKNLSSNSSTYSSIERGIVSAGEQLKILETYNNVSSIINSGLNSVTIDPRRNVGYLILNYAATTADDIRTYTITNIPSITNAVSTDTSININTAVFKTSIFFEVNLSAGTTYSELLNLSFDSTWIPMNAIPSLTIGKDNVNPNTNMIGFNVYLMGSKYFYEFITRF